MPSYAVYQQTPNGLFRVGVFRTRYSSLRSISIAVQKRLPRAFDGGALYVAKREKLFGRYVDGERLPLAKEG